MGSAPSSPSIQAWCVCNLQGSGITPQNKQNKEPAKIKHFISYPNVPTFIFLIG